MHRNDLKPGAWSMWLLGALLAAGGVAGAGEIEVGIFEDGARRRGEEYVRARDVLVRRGPELTGFLRKKTTSGDRQQRIFAEILICRIERPQDVARWNKALAGLVTDLAVLETVKSYREPEWEKLPDKTVEMPASHVVDVLWETAGDWTSSSENRRTAAALQFYLAPQPEAVEAMLDIVAAGASPKYLAREGCVKLGAAAVPHMRQVLRQTVPPTVKDPQQMTAEEEELRMAFWRQMRRATIAAYVLARQQDVESVPLIEKCLRQDGPDQDYIEGLCGALAEMKAVASVDAILDHLLGAADAARRVGSSGEPGYDVLRGHVVRLGRRALAAVKKRLETAETENDRIVLGYLVAELSGVGGKEQEVAALRESLWFDETAAGFLELHRLTGEDVFPRLADLARGMTRRHASTNQRKSAMLTLATMREVRGVSLLAEVLKTQHDTWQSRLQQRGGENAERVDPQVVREGAGSFGWQDNYPADILYWGDAALLALRRIGSEDARKAVAAAVAYDEYKTRAETSLLLIDRRIDRLVTRLDDKDRAVREEAALALLEIGDRRATRELLCAAARRQGTAHQQWKQSALSSRKDVTGELRKLLDSDDVRRRVLAEAMLLEAEFPDKAARCRQSLHAAAQSVAGMHVIRIGMIEAAGRGLVAKAADAPATEPADKDLPSVLQPLDLPTRFGQQAQPLDESYLPLVEAACLFNQGVIRRGVAAFALAEWKKPRSMQVLAASFNMGSLGGSNPAALALADFGPEGAELAAKVPPPKPGQLDTGLRMTRHRGGTRVLAEQKDVRGVDEILKGLQTLEEDPKLNMWSYRAEIYLTAADKFHDRRLVDPLLRILNVAQRPQRDVHAKVIELLAAYDDPRLVPLFTGLLTTSAAERSGFDRGGEFRDVALTALTRRLGEKTPAYLIEQFKASDDDGLRGGALLGLGELSYPEFPAHPGKAEWSPEPFETPEGRAKAAAKTREMAYPVLVAALDDRSPHVSTMAAVGLTILAQGRGAIRPDLRAVEPLTRWCEKHSLCFYPLTKYLAQHGNAETGRVLLAVLKSQPPERGDEHLVDAVGKLNPPDAVPVLARNVRARVAKYKGRYGLPRELAVLAEFGPAGAEALLDIFGEVELTSCRLHAASLLAQKNHRAAVEPIAELLRRTIEAGPANAKLVPLNSESREKMYVRTCASLIESLQSLDPPRAKQIAEGVIRNGPGSLRAACLKVWVN